MPTLLAVESLTKGFAETGVTSYVLNDLSFTLSAGETLALVGPSGSGKTTLLKLIAGLLLPESGSICLQLPDRELEVNRLSEPERAKLRRRYVSSIFQFFNLLPTLTVQENVLLPLELSEQMHLRDQALERLSLLGLGDRAMAYPEVLSGGEQQRVAVVRSLAHQPPLLLADEPTGNLDAGNSEKVVDLLWRQVRQTGTALIIATHSMQIAARADRIISLGE